MSTLTAEDKAIIRNTLGSNSQIYAATVAKLYVATPDPHKWTNTNHIGVIAFLRDISLNSALFFRFIDLTAGKVIWEQEAFSELKYYIDKPFFHSFPGDNYMIGLSFADESEAKQFSEIVLKKLYAALQPSMPKGDKKATEVPTSTVEKSSWFSSILKEPSKEKEKKKKRTVGAPSNFRHLAHIGFDPVTGFDVKNIPPEWKVLFDKAGVTKEQLENKETAKFIVDFVQSQGGPTAKAPVVNRNPPPVPPSKTSRGPPPAPPARTNSGRQIAAPPPPPPQSVQRNSTHEVPAVKLAVPVGDPVRVDLMSSIRQAGLGSLKPVQSNETSPSASNANLADSSDQMASLLAQALAQRNKKIASSDSEESDASEDDEWQ